MPKLPVYGPDEVRTLLDWEGCIHAVRKAMARFTAEGAPQPLRSVVALAPGKLFGLMPGALPDPEPFGAKVVSAFTDPEHTGRSAHQGVVVLFERDRGNVLCIADAGEITRIRTAAASAVATDILARSDAHRLAVFGCGTQAEAHVHALSRVRTLEAVMIWGRSQTRAAEFAARMAQETGLAVYGVADAREAAASADIICTVTGASTPVLCGAWVRAGTHVNVVGSSHAGPVEVDHELVTRSRYVADSRRSAMAAAAEFLLAKEAGLIGDEHIVAEIGEVLLGRVPGRTSGEDVTVYKSLGHVVQDLAATAYVHSRAPNES